MNTIFYGIDHTFALTVSDYGALSNGGDDFMKFKQRTRADLRDIKRAGFDGIEGPWLNVTWNGGEDHRLFAPDRNGLHAPALERLEHLIQEARSLDMVVAPRVSVKDAGHIANIAHNVRLVATELAHYKNVVFDVANEWNGNATAVDVLRLLHASREAAPMLKRTASVSGPIAAQHAALFEMWQIAIRYRFEEPVSFFAPHFDRSGKWYTFEEGNVRGYTDRTPLPVYCQEPHRRGYANQGHPGPAAKEFLFAAKAARKGGAVGWCLHNGYFDLREKRLAAHFDSVEIEAGKAMRAEVGE